MHPGWCSGGFIHGLPAAGHQGSPTATPPPPASGTGVP